MPTWYSSAGHPFMMRHAEIYRKARDSAVIIILKLV